MDLKYELEVTELTDDMVRAELLAFEDKYGMGSEQFIVRFNRGELGCDVDFIDWAGYVEVACAAGILTLVEIEKSA